MVNAWSLAYEELYGDMDKEYPIMKKREDEQEVTVFGGNDTITFSGDGIYDLGQFLNGLALHTRPELDFQNEGYVYIKEGRMRSKYFFADPKVIVTPPEKEITLPSEDVSFTLSTDQLDKLLKAAGIYQLPDLTVVGRNGVVKIQVRDRKNDTSNDFAITVGETDESFSFNFKVENIKILPGTYDVVVSKKLLSRFTSQNYNLKYYIALEPDSTFE